MIVISWLVTALAVVISAYLLPGVTVENAFAALVTALVLGIINAILKPLLIILTLPINILSLGLFTFVINAILILLTSYLVPGFEVTNFWWALLFSMILTLVNGVLQAMFRPTEE